MATLDSSNNVSDGFDRSKFKLSECFNNHSGKTSASATMGIIFGSIAALTWIAIIVAWFLKYPYADIKDLIGETINLIMISGALLGARKLSSAYVGAKEVKNGSTEVSKTLG